MSAESTPTTTETRVSKAALAKALAAVKVNSHQLIWEPDTVDADAIVHACKEAVKAANAAIKLAEAYRDQPAPEARESRDLVLMNRALQLVTEDKLDVAEALKKARTEAKAARKAAKEAPTA